MRCHAERAKEAASSVPFLPSPLGISPSPNCRQIEMSGIQRSGKTNNLLTVPIPLFASSLSPAWWACWLQVGRQLAVALLGLDVQGHHFSVPPWILSLRCYEETHAFTLSFWPMRGRLAFWKTVYLNFITHLFFFSYYTGCNIVNWTSRKKRLPTFFAAFNGSDQASNQRARQRYAFSLPAINNQTQTLHHVEGCIINKHGCYHITILRLIYINCLLSSD